MAWLGWLAAFAGALLIGWYGVRLYRRGQRIVLEERMRKELKARREREREAARAVLAHTPVPLSDVPFSLMQGEQAFFRTPASHLLREADGGFRRLRSGELWVTSRRLVFTDADRNIALRLPMAEIERVDVPFVDVIAFVTFRDTLNRDDMTYFFNVDAPLVCAAHVSRHSFFELML